MRLFAFALALGVAGAVSAARADCAALDRQIRSALAAEGSTGELPRLADAILREGTCTDAYIEGARRRVALALLLAGEASDGSFAPDAVRSAAAVARPWQVSTALGDLAYAARDYPAAVSAYEAAIEEIRNARLVPDPPPREIEEHLAKRAYQAKSLAPAYVASRGFRGEPVGIIAPKFRNFSAVSVPVPIRFDTDEASLTPDGEAAVDDLYNFLSQQAATQVILTGHTDERGTARHNDALSLARAQAVENGLRRRGLTATVLSRGAGESEPFAADDRSKYGPEELHAFDRRVEYELAP